MMSGWRIGSWGALQILAAVDVAGFRVVEKERPPSAQQVIARAVGSGHWADIVLNALE